MLSLKLLTTPKMSPVLKTLTALNLREGMPMLTALILAKGMPILTAPDPTAVDRLSALGSTVTTPSRSWETSENRIPTSRTMMPKEVVSRPSDDKVPLNLSRNLSRVSILGSDEELHSNQCPMASYCLLAAAGPSPKGESLPHLSAPGSAEEGHLNLYPMVNYHMLAVATALGKDESCPGRCRSSSGSSEERHLNLLATLGHVASAPVPTDSLSLTSPSSEAY